MGSVTIPLGAAVPAQSFETAAVYDADWLLFIVTSLVIIATPGQDMVLVMSRSITQGTAAGVATAAGVSTGLIGHTLLATLGLGALLKARRPCSWF